MPFNTFGYLQIRWFYNYSGTLTTLSGYLHAQQVTNTKKVTNVIPANFDFNFLINCFLLTKSIVFHFNCFVCFAESVHLRLQNNSCSPR